MKRRLSPRIPALIALLAAPAIHASLAGGSVINLSGVRDIPLNQPSTVTLRWSMQRLASRRGDPGLTISSPSGQFTDASGRSVLGSVTKALSKSLPIGPPITNVSFTESVQIPREVLYRAYKQGISTLYYRRSFTDCPGDFCSTLAPPLAAAFNVAGSGAGAFGLSRMELRFESGGIGEVIRQNDPLRAEVLIEVTGSGTLKGIWEVATPGSTAGTPFFRSLKLVTRQVGTGTTFRLLSPVLPASQAGYHLVRFRLLEPELSQEVPVLQYVVVPDGPKRLPALETTAPAPGALVDAETLFRWRAVDGANGYQLALFAERPISPRARITPVTGLLVKGEHTQARLTASLLKNLEPGRTYWWHVLALDESGNPLAVSDWRPVQVSP